MNKKTRMPIAIFVSFLMTLFFSWFLGGSEPMNELMLFFVLGIPIDIIFKDQNQ